MADRVGRKMTLIICAVLFPLGALGCAVAPTVEFMILARILLGFAVGTASVTCPLYLAEMALALFLGMMTLPDSPRWHVARGNIEEARRILTISRNPSDVEKDLAAIRDAAHHTTSNKRRR